MLNCKKYKYLYFYITIQQNISSTNVPLVYIYLNIFHFDTLSGKRLK